VAATTEYSGITGYHGNDHKGYIVKLGGVILTGGPDKAYEIADAIVGGVNVGKIVLKDPPTADYELEVRAIQVGSSAVPTRSTLVVPLMETVSVGAAIGGTVNLHLNTQQVYLFTENAADPFTLNLRADVSNPLNGLMGTGNSLSVTVVLKQGANLKNMLGVTIDDDRTPVTPQTVLWQGNNSTMSANKLNVISLTVIKTGSFTYTVLGSMTTVGA
jgi:hypothetical protein